MRHAPTDQPAPQAEGGRSDDALADTPAWHWDDFQIAAMESINAGRSVLVSAPTGAGKTAIAEHAIRQALDTGSDAVYTTPIKALSNQKFRDFRAAYGDENVGLLTGDTTVARDAPLVVMTTEVLRNMLHSEDADSLLSDVTWVVLDEVHYLQDTERGAVWEEIIIHAPAHMRFVCLSATVSNAEQFGQWLRERRGPNFDVIVSEERPVPLTHWHLVRDEQSAELRRVPLLTDAGTPNMDEGGFLDTAPRRIKETWNDDQYDYDSGWRFSTPSTAAVIRQLRDDHHLPSLFFIFSRDRCDKAVTALLRSGMDLVTEDERRRIREIADERLSPLSDQDLRALDVPHWRRALEAGIAAHHAGILPLLKETVERCFDAGLVKVVFATETMALGVNMPARTVVLDKITKWNGQDHAPLTPMQYAQIAGRAGRRGIDNEGRVISLWSPHVPFKTAAELAANRHYYLESSFRPTYNMAVRLARRFDRDAVGALLRKSYAAFQTRLSVKQTDAQADQMQARADEVAREAASPFGDIAEYDQLVSEAAQHTPRRFRDTVDPDVGDVLRLNGGPPIAVLKTSKAADGKRFWAVDARNQVHKFEPPHTDRCRFCGVLNGIPPNISKKGILRRNNTMIVGKLRSGSWQPFPNEAGNPDIDEQVAPHPVHADPAARERLISLSKARKLQRQADQRRTEAAEQTSRLPAQFAAVISVLENFGYLRDWQLTDKGQILTGIHHENDLLIAEAVSVGMLNGLSDAELAGVVSVMVHEQRGQVAADISCAATGNRADSAASEVLRLSHLIRGAEHRAGLHLTKATDMRYAAAASAWASGCTLSEALVSVPRHTSPLSGGDFARNMMILADVLRQLAHAAPSSDLCQQAARVSALVLRGAVTASEETTMPA